MLEMGSGLNETEVIVGNMGSSKSSEYAVVGSGVNMTSRIDSYTVGGRILISESVRREAGEILRIDAQGDGCRHRVPIVSSLLFLQASHRTGQFRRGHPWPFHHT